MMCILTYFIIIAPLWASVKYLRNVNVYKNCTSARCILLQEKPQGKPLRQIKLFILVSG